MLCILSPASRTTTDRFPVLAPRVVSPDASCSWTDGNPTRATGRPAYKILPETPRAPQVLAKARIYSVSSPPPFSSLPRQGLGKAPGDRRCPQLQDHPAIEATPRPSHEPATHGNNARSSVSSVMHRPCNNQPCRGSRVAAAAVLAALMCAAGVADAGTGTFIYAGCSPSKYQPGTPFKANLESLLTSISSAALNGGYNTFTAGANGTGGAPAAYGLYQCRGDLDGGDCAACVRDAVGQLGQVCPAAYAASLQLEGCYVRYDSSNFVGAPDTAMVYRKCSTSSSSDGDFLRSRDAVLGDLQAVGAGGYKVASSGSVRGLAQCLGDLAAADCTACLAQAAGQLKGTCGNALAADVYLAQCYVRYWADGYYFRPTQDYSQDDIGRTLAIVVGIMAGLALFVVFISFLRKTC
ncbi:hypothetical protein SETIT_7G182200v2 [Setaria italica]|nr:hypothetical protein SETIT_7G182200v2 [Setaria italica]